MLFIIINKRY